jgi:hypothetical protein
VAPEHPQVTLPQALVNVMPHCEPHLGSSQHCSFMQVDPAAHANVREPQALLTVPQYVGLGLAGNAQQVPAFPGCDSEQTEPAAQAHLSEPPQPSASEVPHAPT